MTIQRRQLLAASSLLPLGSAFAQADYPNRPIRIISPTAPGSGGDTTIRRIGEPLGKLLGQPIVIENRPGAQTAIGARLVAKAAPDGYTLLNGGNSFLANMHMMKEPGYDVLKDFTPIVLLTLHPYLLTVNADLPVKNVQELVKYAKERPGKLSYGTGNAGSVIVSQLLMTQTGFTAVGVNYPGMPQAAVDLLAGRVDFIMGDPAIVGPHVQSGKLRVLGITSKQRLASFQDVVPIGEQGVSGYDWTGWVGLFGPAGLSPAVVRKVNQAAQQVLADPAMQKYLADNGIIPARTPPEYMQNFMQEQLRLWAKWVKDAGLTPT